MTPCLYFHASKASDALLVLHPVILLHDHAVPLINGIRVYPAPHAGERINVGMTADHGSRIQYGSAAHFHIVAEAWTFTSFLSDFTLEVRDAAPI